MLKRITCYFLVLAEFIAATLLFGCAENFNRTQYEITCEFDGESVFGAEKVTFYNDTDNAFRELKFNLFANAFRKDAKFSPVSAQYYFSAYKWGDSYGDIEITEVAVNGEKADFSIVGEDMNILSVTLANEVFPNERVTAEIGFKTNLAKVIARTGINADTVNLANFYPVLCGIEDGAFYECVYYANGDPFFSEPADYTVNFTCAEKYVVASSGQTITENRSDGKVTYGYKVSAARSFALVLSEKFSVKTAKFGDTEIKYYYFADEKPDESLATAVEALKFFSENWGDYPYNTYSVVETPFTQGGMEFSALTFIGTGLEDKAYKEVIIHETAHMWWQTVVGNNEIKHPFIDEGLAEYSVVLFYENHPDYGFTRENLIKSAEQTYKIYCSVYGKIVGEIDTTMTRSLPEYSSEYEYVNIAYVKSCIMFDYLRQTVGDAKFFAGIRRFYDENAFKTATPESLIGAFERAGADANGFFESFYNGKAII